MERLLDKLLLTLLTGCACQQPAVDHPTTVLDVSPIETVSVYGDFNVYLNHFWNEEERAFTRDINGLTVIGALADPAGAVASYQPGSEVCTFNSAWYETNIFEGPDVGPLSIDIGPDHLRLEKWGSGDEVYYLRDDEGVDTDGRVGQQVGLDGHAAMLELPPNFDLLVEPDEITTQFDIEDTIEVKWSPSTPGTWILMEVYYFGGGIEHPGISCVLQDDGSEVIVGHAIEPHPDNYSIKFHISRIDNSLFDFRGSTVSMTAYYSLSYTHRSISR